METTSLDMQRNFTDRAELMDYLRAEFPAAAAVDGHVSDVRGGRAAAENALHLIDPVRYASTRNYLDGAVTRLSPYLRHGVLGMDEVRRHALDCVRAPQRAGKLISELGWRDYFQRVYATIGRALWNDLEPYKTGHDAHDYAAELPADLREARTGLACMDAFSRQLQETGYLHNHARMWLAAYAVHWRRVRWQAGARWFLSHLLDGDPASNNLSWQWVASTFSHKPYIFNRQNLERFTNGVYCRDCPLLGRCAFEGDYETLAEELFPGATQSQPAKQKQQNGVQSPARKALAHVESTRVNTDTAPTPSPPQAAASVVWIHGDNLNPHSPALRAEPNTPAIWVWDDALLTRQQIGLKRIVFLYECLLELPVTIRRGNVAQEILRFAAEHDANQVATMDSVSPGFAAGVAEIQQQLPVAIWREAPFIDYAGTLDLRRFSRYWRCVQHLAQA